MIELKDSYLGNANVKRDGVSQQWTQEQVLEYAKCMQDPSYFTKKYVKIISLDKGLVPFNLYPYQEEMFNHFTKKYLNKDLKKFENDFLILSVLRNFKILGIFSRLAKRDDKNRYLKYIPYTWSLIKLRTKNRKVFDELRLILNNNKLI